MLDRATAAAQFVFVFEALVAAGMSRAAALRSPEVQAARREYRATL